MESNEVLSRFWRRGEAARLRLVASLLLGPSSSLATGCVVFVGLAVGLTLGLRDIRTVLYDDAAIYLRYAYRIGHGLGFTYNNGDHTDGSSSPLWPLILSPFSAAGLNLETVDRVSCAVLYGVSFGLASWLVTRLAGILAALLAIIVLAASADYRLEALAGLEPAGAITIALSALLCFSYRREKVGAALLGLAVLYKFDALLLVGPFYLTYTLVRRRLPIKLGLISFAVVLPWLIFAQIYFGTVIPNDMRVKLTTLSRGTTMNHMWIVNAVRADGDSFFVCLGAICLLFAIRLARSNPETAVVLGTIVAWPIAYAVAYSFINLGAPYPWYKTLLYPPIAVASAAVIGLLGREALNLWSRAGPISVGARIACAAIIGLGVFAASTTAGRMSNDAETIVHGHQEDAYEAFEGTRRASGIYLSRIDKPGQVIQDCFGWIAYENEAESIDETCPLNTRKPVALPTWGNNVSYPGFVKPVLPSGETLVRVFASNLGSGGDSWIYRIHYPK